MAIMTSRMDESVFHALRRAMQEHGARWQAKLPGLTKPQYAVLVAISETPGLDQGAAGQRAATDKATLANLLLRLEERGLITRTVGTDRRRRELRLTPAGEELLAAAMPVVDRVNESMLAPLDDDERRQLVALLTKLAI